MHQPNPVPKLLSVIVPCYNEEANVAVLEERVRLALRGRFSYEIIFVNDGSADATAEAIEELRGRHPDSVVTLHHDSNSGIEAAWTSALRAARGELVCLIDADLQNRPEDISKLHDLLLESGADMAQGSRVTPDNGDRSRLLFSRCLNFVLNSSFGMNLDDNKSGFVLTRREALEDVLAHELPYRYFQCLLAVAAHSKGYRIAQTPTVFCRRERGVSFMGRFPLAVIVGCLRDVLVGLIEYRLLRALRARRRR